MSWFSQNPTDPDEFQGYQPQVSNAQKTRQLVRGVVPEILQALVAAESFIAEELETREGSFLPGPDLDEVGYIGSAKSTLDLVRTAIAKAEGRNV